MNIKLTDTPSGSATPTLAMRPRETAKALSISERTLWDLTSSDAVPHLKIGRATLYPVKDLEVWLSAKAKAEGGSL